MTPVEVGLLVVGIVLLALVISCVLFYIHTINTKTLDPGFVDDLSAQVQALAQRPVSSALVYGNNGAVSCPAFCNNKDYYGIVNQVPSMAVWRGATSMRVDAQNGFCDCVEDPTHPFGTIPRTSPISGSQQVYALPQEVVDSFSAPTPASASPPA